MQRTDHEVSVSQAFRVLIDRAIVETSGGEQRGSKTYRYGMEWEVPSARLASLPHDFYDVLDFGICHDLLVRSFTHVEKLSLERKD